MEFVITTGMIWITFAIAILVTTIASAVLVYHWRSYGMGSARVAKGMRTYFSGIALFMTLSLIFAIVITLKP